MCTCVYKRTPEHNIQAHTRAHRASSKDDDGCFYDHSWRNNVVIAFGTLSSFGTWFHVVNGVVYVVCTFAGDEKLEKVISI